MRSKEWAGHNLPLLLACAVTLALVVVIQSFQLPGPERTETVGCVLVGSREDKGWNQSHYTGLLEACETHGCSLHVRELVPEDKTAVMRAVDSLVDEGCSAIYLTSFGYGDYINEVAKKYPRVAFFSIWGTTPARNAVTYFARLYQVRYLAGLIAGTESRTGVLGYVAAMPNSQTNRGINAYALGMRTANPDARLIVRFTGSWDDEKTERESVMSLAAQGADVITYHEDQPHVIREAERLGLMSVGYESVYEEYSDRFLTAALYDWKLLYKKVLGDYLSGRTNFSSGSGYWLGLEEDAVRMHTLSPRVSEKAIFLASMEKQRIMYDLTVFSGVIYDNEGRLRCGAGERIKDNELFTGMDWFVEGVEIYE